MIEVIGLALVFHFYQGFKGRMGEWGAVAVSLVFIAVLAAGCRLILRRYVKNPRKAG
ncbi:MAG: hypothetical protein JSS23_01270 [Proteobacteria bacterium]|nr:hypothetical protein [Pseudomonadota bacterium]